MRLPLVVAFLFFALPAVAQTGTAVTFTTTATAPNNIVVSARGDCGSTLRFNWSRTGNLCNGGNLYFYVTTGTCGSQPAATDLQLDAVTGNTTTTGVLTFTVASVLAKLATPTTCDSQTTEVTFKLCASTPTISDSINLTCSSTYSSVGTPPFQVNYDPEPPSAPSIGDIIARDSALSVQVDNAEADSLVIVELNALTTAGTDDAGTGEVTEGPTLSFRKASSEGNVVADGLINGVTYRVRAKVQDEAGNVSEPSAALEGTPVKSNGLFDAYKNANGQEEGGCSSTGGGLAGGAVLAALGLWLSSRRKVS
ncbi:MYXO-CTERM sorting domain-containing protein [Corallococcus sp. bb12-1]|uniref:MXAN_2561 family MXYO-CTERM-anchored protein n=1 Tax=Corallococcus sp. bb12-1 TaxID=2996784 RepID=UPI00226DF7C7|nr:MXAN_2561 family MXYO-CTERM-anchored protein [Corallococcus sp. bb12-1]MCY1045266.1 MYXO-CTERM sorting domain-containing protein [Corallococcus sp. bb12-1]